MKARNLVIFLFVGLVLPVWADVKSVLIPQTVYVGDRGRLVLTLQGDERSKADSSVVIDVADRLPKSKDLVIHRIEIENKESLSRVFIDFVAYVPGTIDFPTIEAGNLVLKDLHASIASILEESGSELAPPAAPLRAPGTALLLYGAAFTLLILILILILFFRRIVPAFRSFEEARLNSLASRSLRRLLTQIRSKGGDELGISLLASLITELRSFLSRKTGVNWRVLTPLECRNLKGGLYLESTDIEFLADLFQRSDAARFGGRNLRRDEVHELLDHVSSLADRFEINAARRNV